MQHGDMHYLDDLVDEDGQESFIVELQQISALLSRFAVLPVLIQCVSYQMEDRVHQPRGLDQEGGELRIPLESLEQEVKDGIQ